MADALVRSGTAGRPLVPARPSLLITLVAQGDVKRKDLRAALKRDVRSGAILVEPGPNNSQLHRLAPDLGGEPPDATD